MSARVRIRSVYAGTSRPWPRGRLRWLGQQLRFLRVLWGRP